MHVDDLEGAADVARRLDTPIALDESITSEAAARTAIRFGAADILNVKPARVGGPVEASRIVQTAADLGVPAFVGGMLETGVGRGGGVGRRGAHGMHAADRPRSVGPLLRRRPHGAVRARNRRHTRRPDRRRHRR